MRASELARGVGQVLVAWPRFVAAPLYRRWHLRWGATNEVWPWLVQLQQIQVGDRVPMSGTVNETTAFKVNGFEPQRWLLWAKPDSTWAWQLTPVDGGQTRLVTLLKQRYPWRASPGGALLTVVLFEFGDFPMMRKLLLGIRRRAERLAGQRTATVSRPP